MESFGFGDGNLYEWYPKGLQKEKLKQKISSLIWNGQKVDLSVKSIHYVPDGTGLKYDRIIGWKVRYLIKNYMEKNRRGKKKRMKTTTEEQKSSKEF